MQTSKEKILSTGPLDYAILQEAEQGGFELEVIPFIETIIENNPSAENEIAELVKKTSTVIFTSKQAVEAVALNLKGILPSWKIYCTGNTTASLVRRYFGEHTILGTAPDAISLSVLIAGNDHSEELVFFCGDQRRDELPDFLQSKNIRIREVVVYRTVPVYHQLENKYGAILFYSPSAVQAFFENNEAAPETILFAIGNTTADAIKKYSGNEIIIANQPDKAELVKTAIHYLTQKQASKL